MYIYIYIYIYEILIYSSDIFGKLILKAKTNIKFDI